MNVVKLGNDAAPILDLGRGNITTPLWPDAAALQADCDALAVYPEAQRMVAVLDAAIRGRTHVTALFPPIGRQKAETANGPTCGLFFASLCRCTSGR